MLPDISAHTIQTYEGKKKYEHHTMKDKTLHHLMFWIKLYKPKELWDGPKKVLSDWPGCDRWEEKNGDACGLIGGDGEGELKGAELLKDPGMLTGAELWNWLPPVKEKTNMFIYTCILLNDVHI